MNLTKVLTGVATLAAMVLMLFGVSSAMAESTVLCSSDEEGRPNCAAGNVVNAVHYTGTINVLTSLGNVPCNALFSGTPLGLASPLIIHGNFTYSLCPNGCEVIKELSTGGLIKLLKTGATNGTFVGEGFEMSVECFLSGISCAYSFVGLGGGMTSANLPTTAGKMTISEQALSKTGGFFCPKTAKLDLTMESLTDVYIKN